MPYGEIRKQADAAGGGRRAAAGGGGAPSSFLPKLKKARQRAPLEAARGSRRPDSALCRAAGRAAPQARDMWADRWAAEEKRANWVSAAAMRS
jgi:hypothetical protein